MKFDRLNQWLTVLSNLGVIGGFVLVAMQLQQNTAAIRLQSQTDFDQSYATMEQVVLGDSAYATIAKAMLHPAELTEEQAYQLFVYVSTQANIAFKVWAAFQAGQASEAAWNDAKSIAMTIGSPAAARIAWNRDKVFFDKAFVAEIDAEIARQDDRVHDAFRGMLDDLRALEPTAARTQ